MKDWPIGIWDRITQHYSAPSFSIPDVLTLRGLTNSVGYMPAGPYVNKYDALVYAGNRPNEYGKPSLFADVSVDWKPEVLEAWSVRKRVFGDLHTLIEKYHSRLAISAAWLNLNELTRKIQKTITNIDLLKRLLEKKDPRWDEVVLKMHERLYKAMRYDELHLSRYIDEHATASVVPGTLERKPVKWGMLTTEGKHHLYELCHACLGEYMLPNWSTVKQRIYKPDYIGRGRRSRSPEIEGILQGYRLEYKTSRQVGYDPTQSPWFAFIDDSSKNDIYHNMVLEAESILGCNVLSPPLEKGKYWKEIYDVMQGKAYVTGDGSNWETWSAMLTGMYIEAVNDGIPQFKSGAAVTSLNATIASYILLQCRIGDQTRQLDTVAALGDDISICGPDKVVEGIQTLGEIWKVDELGTKALIVLGVVMLPEYHGTFPGLPRISIDRSDAIQSVLLNERTGPVEPRIDIEQFKFYHEIMTLGTIGGTPLLEKMAEMSEIDFWDKWITDRFEYLVKSKGEQLPRAVPYEEDDSAGELGESSYSF